MASKPLTGTQDLSTKTVTYSTELGRGAFATVYRAKCDELPCAAKILFTIFQNDPGFATVLDKFLTECEYLKNIRHPNVVQYLGLCQEPTTNQPVLLMELMDDSLTHFLDKSKTPLSRHVQLSLCHDVALALAHLHSLGIVHRDLSSNNVLLIGPGSRAKVSDFGMSKAIDTRNSKYMTPLTTVPGTVVYMPQEALGENPNYTEKLDCFSFGVLAIQIMTRIFPNPTPSSRMKTIKSDLGPSGTILVPVLETECRKEHIDMISETHPLLEIAVDCLSLKMEDRPQAHLLCCRIEDLKRSVGPEKVATDEMVPDSVGIAKLQDENQQQQEEEISTLRKQLNEKSQKYSELEAINVELKKRLSDQMQPDRKLGELKQLPPGVLSIKCWKTGTSAPKNVAKASTTVIGDVMCCCLSSESVYNYSAKDDTWEELPKFRGNMKVSITFQKETGKLVAVKNQMISMLRDGEWRSWLGATDSNAWAVLSHGIYILLLYKNYIRTFRIGGNTYAKHSVVYTLPWIGYSSATVCDDAVYLTGVYNYNSWNNRAFKLSMQKLFLKRPWYEFSSQVAWQEIASLPVTRSTCVSFNDHLLAVGGLANKQACGDIFEYDGDSNTWVLIGSIPTPRYNCLAEVVDNKLIVIGGWPNDFTMCNIVEIATLNF